MNDLMQIQKIGSTSGPIIVFIHGWPDDSSVWDNQVEYFKNDYHCLLVTLPNFDSRDSNDKPKDFPELVELIYKYICSYDSKVILIGHDWGAYLAYLIEKAHPEKIHRLIGLDVGGDLRSLPVLDSIGIILYQSWLIGAWSIRNFIPSLADNMTQAMASGIRAPQGKRAQAKMNFLYFFFWRNKIIPAFKKNQLKNYSPKCPVFYLYAAEKPLMFHSSYWLKMLEEKNGCKVLRVEKAGHWLMRDQADLVNKEIELFLTAGESQ